MTGRRPLARIAIGVVVVLASACADSDGSAAPQQRTETTAAATTLQPAGAATTATAPEAPPATEPPAVLLAGAASTSVLPTVDGNRDYLDRAPGWDDLDPDDPGVFVAAFDQGRVDVGNGSADAAWVHDDLRASALALQYGGQTVIVASVDVYMIFAADGAEIERRARALLPADLAADAHIVIAATHNHHGPDTAFSVNDEWYSLMADSTAEAIAAAAAALEPATLAVATGEHRFGMADVRDPLIVDPRLNVLAVNAVDGGTIATVVQWTSHPETTLGWAPPIDLTEACAAKGWAPDDCSAEGRYFTADYPGLLRERLQQSVGGEVLYLNGALGSQIGPGQADVWQVDDAHPVGDGITPPAGAQPVAGAADFRTRSMARTTAIGEQLAAHVIELFVTATPVDDVALGWSEQSFYTRLTNIGFRVLLADGDLGWQTPTAYVCGPKPFTDATCSSDEGRLVDDPVLTPLVDSQIREGDVLRTRLVHVDLGPVGLLFMPGELPPELVVGLPADFASNTTAYYREPELHAVGADYVVPGALLDLVDDDITFTVGLGGDELGYWVPIDEVRLKCLDLVLSGGVTCQQLFDEGLLVTPDAIGGPLCRQITDDPASLAAYRPEIADALAATCRYGQALGRELGEPAGHYEETNSAGWDLVDDTWAAALELFGR